MQQTSASRKLAHLPRQCLRREKKHGAKSSLHIWRLRHWRPAVCGTRRWTSQGLLMCRSSDIEHIDSFGPLFGHRRHFAAFLIRSDADVCKLSFLNLCSSHSHSQRRRPFALFSSLPCRPRCPDDASQKRFSWFSDWLQKMKRKKKEESSFT